VLVTRAVEDAQALASALVIAGLQPVVVPLVERRWLPLAVAELAAARPDASVVLITSAAAAEVVAAGAPNAWRSARWAAVGPATASRLAELGYSAAVVPERATAFDLVTALGDLTGEVVVYPRADLASSSTIEALRASGATVADVVAYENAAPHGFEARLRRALPVHATTLMSSSAAERLADAIPPEDRGQLGKIVCVGPSTASAAKHRGLFVTAVAEPHTLAGVVSAVRRLL
jgi:uroporphyrinogen-III synthase